MICRPTAPSLVGRLDPPCSTADLPRLSRLPLFDLLNYVGGQHPAPIPTMLTASLTRSYTTSGVVNGKTDPAHPPLNVSPGYFHLVTTTSM